MNCLRAMPVCSLVNDKGIESTFYKAPRPSARVLTLSHVPTPKHKNKCEPYLLCGIFGARSSSTTATPQGCDMSMLWLPTGHGAVASAVLEGTLTECVPVNDSCNSSCEFEDLRDQVLSTSIPHPRRGLESESP